MNIGTDKNELNLGLSQTYRRYSLFWPFFVVTNVYVIMNVTSLFERFAIITTRPIFKNKTKHFANHRHDDDKAFRTT